MIAKQKLRLVRGGTWDGIASLGMGGRCLMEFRNRLRELRRRDGLTQKQLTDKLNWKTGVISRLEGDGKSSAKRGPDVDQIALLCDHFKVTADQLIGRVDLQIDILMKKVEPGPETQSKESGAVEADVTGKPHKKKRRAT